MSLLGKTKGASTARKLPQHAQKRHRGCSESFRARLPHPATRHPREAPGPAPTLHEPGPAVQFPGLAPAQRGEGAPRGRRPQTALARRLLFSDWLLPFVKGGTPQFSFHFLFPPLPEVLGFYFRLPTPSLRKSTCSLRPRGVSGWVPFYDPLGKGRRLPD